MRALILGNGSLLVTLDATGEVRDLYFPHAGLENHTGGDTRHRIGVYCDGALSWLSEDPRWEIQVSCEEDSLEQREFNIPPPDYGHEPRRTGAGD
ncbi:MAG: hypothetical protein B7W98_00165 [Parcubacteria group bacterium 20-58-5]|nr:MAG: hypothetical protein B7W98_00165 [Parcubacteria group bacterium 20-58-5]